MAGADAEALRRHMSGTVGGRLTPQAADPESGWAGADRKSCPYSEEWYQYLRASSVYGSYYGSEHALGLRLQVT